MTEQNVSNHEGKYPAPALTGESLTTGSMRKSSVRWHRYSQTVSRAASTAESPPGLPPLAATGTLCLRRRGLVMGKPMARKLSLWLG